jgi:hypothetical protein
MGKAMSLIDLLPEIGPYAFCLLVYLMSIAVDGECSPGYEDMRRATKFTNHHISQALHVLENTGLISKVKGYQTITRIKLGFSQNSSLQNSSLQNCEILECTTTSLINLKSSSTLQNSRILKARGLEEDAPTLGALSSAFVRETHIPELTGGPLEWTKALDEMVAAGVEEQDVVEAVQILRRKKFTITTLRSIVRTAITAMSERKSNGKINEAWKNEYSTA